MLTTPLRTVRHRDTQTHLPDSPTFSRLGQIPRSFLGSPSETLAQGTLQYSHIRSYGSDSIPRGYLSPPSPNYITSALATLNFCPDTDDFFTISKESPSRACEISAESLKSIWAKSPDSSGNSSNSDISQEVKLMDVLGRDSSGFASAFGTPLSEHPFAADMPSEVLVDQFTEPRNTHRHTLKILNKSDVMQGALSVECPAISSIEARLPSPGSCSHIQSRSSTPLEIKQYRCDPLGPLQMMRRSSAIAEPFRDDYSYINQSTPQRKQHDDTMSPHFPPSQAFRSKRSPHMYTSSQQSVASSPLVLFREYEGRIWDSSVSTPTQSRSSSFEQATASSEDRSFTDWHSGLNSQAEYTWSDPRSICDSPTRQQQDVSAEKSPNRVPVEHIDQGLANSSSLGMLKQSDLSVRSPSWPHDDRFLKGHSRAQRFFVIKSFSLEDIRQAVSNSVWASTPRGNDRLDSAWQSSLASEAPVLLFFSVNGSGQFCAVGQLMSGLLNEDKEWLGAKGRWRGHFKIKFHYLHDVPNSLLRNIKVSLNLGKSVVHSRDTQELDQHCGENVLKVFQSLHSGKYI